MRATHLLLFALLFALLAVSTAFAGDRPSQGSSNSSSQLDLLQPAPDGLAIANYRLPFERSFDWRNIYVDGRPYQDSRLNPVPTCFTMRTYRMQRVEPHSDVTEPRSYRTCQPDLKYSFREAVQEPAK